MINKDRLIHLNYHTEIHIINHSIFLLFIYILNSLFSVDNTKSPALILNFVIYILIILKRIFS
jgi:hypothetical protein